MNFLEAMALLNAKKSVTRKVWEGKGIVLSSLEDMSFKFWLPESQSELMRVTDWIECEPLQYFTFLEAIKALLHGASIKRPRWSKWILLKEKELTCSKPMMFYIFYSLNDRDKAVPEFLYKFEGQDFVAEDWIIEKRIK
jgi:hypothetical protein